MKPHRVPVSADGTMVLPSSLRQQLNVTEDGLLVIYGIEGRLVLGGVEDAIRHTQALVRRYAPAVQGVTDELVAERRAEAASE